MAYGFVRDFLLHSKQVFQGVVPSFKLTPAGYLKGLLRGDRATLIENVMSRQSGHFYDATVKYKVRTLASDTSTDDNCDIDIRPVYREAAVDALSFRKLAIYIPDETIEKYEEEASRSVRIGQPATQIMMELMDDVIRSCQGMFQAIDSDLLTIQASAFGVNATTGLATAKTINFDTDATDATLTQGMGEVNFDVMNNEMDLSQCWMVGGGLLARYMMQQQAKGLDTKGVDTSRIPYAPFYFDPLVESLWAANNFAVIEKNAVQLIVHNNYKGFKAGHKGVSDFGVLNVPLVDSLGDSQLSAFPLDMQLKYFDCPTEVTVAGYEGTQTLNRGWALILSARFGQFTVPDNAYKPTDRLEGNRGSLRYVATNTT